MTVVYICWECGRDFEVSEHDGLTDSLEILCPACASDLVAVDFAEVRRRRFQKTPFSTPSSASSSISSRVRVP